MRLPEVWDDYMVVGEEGVVVGIREDTPKEVKEAYEKARDEYVAYLGQSEAEGKPSIKMGIPIVET